MIGTRDEAEGTAHSMPVTWNAGREPRDAQASAPDPRAPRSRSGVGRRATRVVALAALLSALLAVIFVGGRYLLESRRGAAANLPGLSTISQGIPPRFLFSINGVSRPLGVALSPAGDRIYVTESDGARETRVFDRDGRPVGVLNPPDTVPASRTPVYLAVDPEGQVYVSDRQMGAVHIYSPDGSYLGQVPPPEGAGSTWAPLALAFGAGGNLLVTEVTPGKHGVALLARDGSVLGRFGREGDGDGEFSYPNGVAVDQQGNILVADSNNGRILSFDASGKLLWALGRGGTAAALGLPRGLAVDERNRMYVADTTNHVVLVFQLGDRDARLLFTIGGDGIKDGQFSFPNGLAIDRGDRLYVTDRENNRVQVWTY